ncbi:thioesterase family protein [Actinokineospora pegani]|uniref:thioesterase family protein n=1 Tax=Actinokineospora pegani TaxID=2654637 RepID=UPI001F18D842|nr:thioesterase family protein [Actinokineospora pegani]
MGLRLLRVALPAYLPARAGADVLAPATTRFLVVPGDLDVLRHMNNGRYLSIMDVARMDLFTKTGLWRTAADNGWHPVVAAQTIAYRRSLRLWERFTVRTRLIGVDSHNLYFDQRFRLGEVECARAVVGCRFLRRTGGSVTPAELAEAFGGFGELPELPAWVPRWATDLRAATA